MRGMWKTETGWLHGPYARDQTPLTRAEALADLIDKRIRSSGLTPGTLVGTMEQIRLESGVARATVSEAIRLLRDRGVLKIRPGRGGGLFVADQGPAVRMRHTLLTVRDTPGSVADAIELRNHLEDLICLAAARHRGERDIGELRGCLAEMAAAPGWDGFVRANWALHERIAALCPNEMARAVYVATLGQLARPHLSNDSDEAYREQRMQVHADLVDAIAAGDEEAVRATVARHNTSD